MIDPTSTFSAARYQALADAAIAGIAERGKRVVVVGGTGLYLRVLLHGVVERRPATRAARSSRPRRRERGRRRCTAGSPPSTRCRPRIEPGDLVRIIRALEIHALTGAPPPSTARGTASPRTATRTSCGCSTRRARGSTRRSTGAPEACSRPACSTRCAALRRAGATATPRRWAAWVRAGARGGRGAPHPEGAIAEAAQKTRRYAKRQQTWFKKEPGAIELAPPYVELADFGSAPVQPDRTLAPLAPCSV